MGRSCSRRPCGRSAVRALSLVLVLALAAAAPVAGLERGMVVHFVDVGQADATLVELPCGVILVDAGAPDDRNTYALVGYLAHFFRVQRPDLRERIDAVFVTHNHIDHTRALRAVAETFEIGSYVDNGQLSGFGTENPRWLRDQVASGALPTAVREVADTEVRAVPGRAGLSDAAIDPLDCRREVVDEATGETATVGVDPEIRVLAGRKDANPGWPSSEFSNKNNHSLVIRVDYGGSSILFTGDLEEPAIEELVHHYDGTDRLDVDVYQVGHHGSHNGTTEELVAATSPEAAVVSMGRWYDGRHEESRFATWFYGHPRRQVIEQLEGGIAGPRELAGEPRFKVASSARRFRLRTIERAIYATGWDGTLRLLADDAGVWRVER